MKRVLYFGFWGGNDPLTTSTVLPTIRVLLAEHLASHVHLVTLERSGDTVFPKLSGIPGLTHSPLYAAHGGPRMLNRMKDLWSIPRSLSRMVRQERVDLLIARSSLAGTSVRRAAQGSGLPYVVESFEPHAEYMVQGGEWSAWGPFALMTERIERQQREDADHLLPVTHNYAGHLEGQGVQRERIHVVPCPVDLDHFRYDPTARQRMRDGMGVTDEVVGIYVGKFGGLYHNELAYEAFTCMHTHLRGKFRLILLTPAPKQEVEHALHKAGFPLEHALVRFVEHGDVPAYLSAADFGIAPYRGTPSSAYISPVKNGEYWSTGLPVLLTRNVSDDSAIIERHPEGGALFDPEGNDLEHGLDRIIQQVGFPGQRGRTRELALKYRSPDHLRSAYAKVFGALFPSAITQPSGQGQ